MSTNEFVDYYELLQLSPNADVETIERLYRHLAKKFHPDNPSFANKDRFLKVSEAHQVLSDPDTRAGYDVTYQDYWNHKWTRASEASLTPMPCADKVTRERLLSLLYVQRRKSMKRPGLAENEMARLLNTPLELVEFHLWYLKAKGWVERLDTGHLAITALGVDEAEKSSPTLSLDHLIEDHHGSANGDAEDQEDIDRHPVASNL
jgi:hypothetical protein